MQLLQPNATRIKICVIIQMKASPFGGAFIWYAEEIRKITCNADERCLPSAGRRQHIYAHPSQGMRMQTNLLKSTK
jgi:hypothetical protein